MRKILGSLRFRASKFVDPFAGGGIIPLTVAFEDLADKVVMGEIDENVAAVWKTILVPSSAEWLAKRILEFDLNRDAVISTLASKPRSLRDKAFQTILRNRVQRGGIMAQGAGLIKTGEGGRGLASRWYPETLAKRILSISKYKNDPDCIYFIDPPYTAGGKKAGSRLYFHNELDHYRLFRSLSRVRGAAILTYDDADEVNELARNFRFDIHTVGMKNTHHAKMNELLLVKHGESR